jgi:hypothetical protein
MPKMDQKKKNVILVTVMVIIIGVTVFIAFKDKFIGGPDFNIDDTLISPAFPGSRIPKNIAEEVFLSTDFKDLKDYSTRELSTSTEGRSNPFEPFQIELE